MLSSVPPLEIFELLVPFPEDAPYSKSCIILETDFRVYADSDIDFIDTGSSSIYSPSSSSSSLFGSPSLSDASMDHSPNHFLSYSPDTASGSISNFGFMNMGVEIIDHPQTVHPHDLTAAVDYGYDHDSSIGHTYHPPPQLARSESESNAVPQWYAVPMPPPASHLSFLQSTETEKESLGSIFPSNSKARLSPRSQKGEIGAVSSSPLPLEISERSSDHTQGSAPGPVNFAVPSVSSGTAGLPSLSSFQPESPETSSFDGPRNCTVSSSSSSSSDVSSSSPPCPPRVREASSPTVDTPYSSSPKRKRDLDIRGENLRPVASYHREAKSRVTYTESEYVDSDDEGSTYEGYADSEEEISDRRKRPRRQSKRNARKNRSGEFKCHIPGCDKTFSRIHDAKRHIKSKAHAPEGGEYLCKFCDRSFNRKDSRNRHERDACNGADKKKTEEKGKFSEFRHPLI